MPGECRWAVIHASIAATARCAMAARPEEVGSRNRQPFLFVLELRADVESTDICGSNINGAGSRRFPVVSFFRQASRVGITTRCLMNSGLVCWSVRPETELAEYRRRHSRWNRHQLGIDIWQPSDLYSGTNAQALETFMHFSGQVVDGLEFDSPSPGNLAGKAGYQYWIRTSIGTKRHLHGHEVELARTGMPDATNGIREYSHGTDTLCERRPPFAGPAAEEGRSVLERPCGSDQVLFDACTSPASRRRSLRRRQGLLQATFPAMSGAGLEHREMPVPGDLVFRPRRAAAEVRTSWLAAPLTPSCEPRTK